MTEKTRRAWFFRGILATSAEVGLDLGYALDTTTKSFDLERALSLKVEKIGVGLGAMAATGPAGTATFTSPPIPVKELYRFFLGPAPSEGRDSDTTH